MNRHERLARTLGCVLGLAIAAAAVVHWAIPPGTGHVGADVSFVAWPTGELEIGPGGVFVNAIDIGPGTAKSTQQGAVSVRNQTGSRLAVRLRALPSIRDLDGVVRVEVRAGAAAVFRGPLGELRSWSRRSFELSSGEHRQLEVRAWIPKDVGDGYGGRIDDIVLEFRSTPVRGEGA